MPTAARLFGFGVMWLALVGLAWGEFDPGQPVPRDVPGRAILAYAAAILLLLGGAALQFRRTVTQGAAALAIYYLVVVVVFMNGRIVVAHDTEFGAYSGTAEQLAIAAAALVVFACSAGIDAALAERLVRIGSALFGVCAIAFGCAHFVYLGLTAPLVPPWLPPSQAFWAYATGVGQIAAGLAILTGFKARLAGALLAIMYACFALLVHAPMLVASPASRGVWSENALNLVLTGAAWIVAASFGAGGKRLAPFAGARRAHS
jgi:uncharacterized membrane protein YphA (DoxX/SURF4 family)